MSLINQMLRDLEARRKTGSPQQASGEVAPPDGAGSAGDRWRWILLLGIALGGVAWLGLKISSDPIGQPVVKTDRATPVEVARGSVESSASLPVVVSQAAVPVAEKSPVKTVANRPTPAVEEPKPLVAVVKTGRATVATPAAEASRPAAVVVKKTAPAVAVAPATPLNIASKVGMKGAALVDIGIVEGIDSVRLMFEFEKLPAYRIRAVGLDATEITVSFIGAQKSSRLELPPFRGPLLTLFELQTGEQGVQLSLVVAKPIKVDAYSLPADAVHGDRLLLDLSADRVAIASSSQRSPGTMGEKLRNQQVSSGTDPKQQAEILYRKGLRYLEQGNEGAAKIQFTKSLDLHPGNVELRIRLVDMLVNRQQSERAENLLIAGLTLLPENPVLRTYYGRLLLDHNQVAAALNLLLAKPIPSLPEQPDYHALLAALEQENGQFANAATRYRELLQIRPEQADWWLMLAIAYEGLEEVKLAGSAYRQALERSGLSTEHRQFALQRLERLQRIDN